MAVGGWACDHTDRFLLKEVVSMILLSCTSAQGGKKTNGIQMFVRLASFHLFFYKSGVNMSNMNVRRILSRDVKSYIGEEILMQGWLHKKRLLGGLTFILLRDRAGVTQIAIEDKSELAKLDRLQTGTVLEVVGAVKEDPRAPGGVEIRDPKLTVMTPVTEVPSIEIDKPLSHKSDNLDTLFDYRVIGLRNLREQAIFKIQASVRDEVRAYLKSQDFTEFNSPKLLPGATEGGAEVFKLDYFGKEATLAQSAQFYKQMLVGVYERVFEIGSTYRAEPSATPRHMTEFQTIDVEVGFIELQDLLNLMSGFLNSVVENVWQKCDKEFVMWGATRPVLTKEVPQMTMEEIHKKYSASNKEQTIGEKDLRPDEERWICEYAKEKLGSEAIFVIDWPREGAKFYHKFKDDNPNVAERADLLFRGVEIATGSMREYRYDKLVKQLKEMAGGDPDSDGFRYFFQAFKYGMPSEGGFGMGLERLTQKIIGLGNVKEATLFPRDINRLTP